MSPRGVLVAPLHCVLVSGTIGSQLPSRSVARINLAGENHEGVDWLSGVHHTCHRPPLGEIPTLKHLVPIQEAYLAGTLAPSCQCHRAQHTKHGTHRGSSTATGAAGCPRLRYPPHVRLQAVYTTQPRRLSSWALLHVAEVCAN